MKDKLRLTKLSLDLLDNSKLTSLPFPPPLKKSKSRFRKYHPHSLHSNHPHHTHRNQYHSPTRNFGSFSSNNSKFSTSSPIQSPTKDSRFGIPTSEFTPNLPKLNDLSKFNDTMEDVSFTSIDTLTSNANMTTEIDESFDEPIILVEDYLKPPVSTNNLNRQQSLANFKQRLNHDQLINNNKRKISGDTLTEEENLEEIFGDIPGKQSLKYCDICDKPLYEISSLISNKRFKPSFTSFDTKKIDTNLFNEFICFECIDLYEEFLQEIYQDSQQTNESKNLKLLLMFKNIQNRSNSNNKLIEKLKFLNSNNIFNEELNWLNNLQNKLRWRWRLNGLLPNFKRNKST